MGQGWGPGAGIRQSSPGDDECVARVENRGLDIVQPQGAGAHPAWGGSQVEILCLGLTVCLVRGQPHVQQPWMTAWLHSGSSNREAEQWPLYP